MDGNGLQDLNGRKRAPPNRMASAAFSADRPRRLKAGSRLRLFGVADPPFTPAVAS
jgi:hypothetical protein